MDEFKIKGIFEHLIKKIIIPKYPFLEFESLRTPSQSLNPLSTTFFLIFNLNKKVPDSKLIEIENEVKDLFSSAGFSHYPYKDFYFHIRVAFDDLESDERFYRM